MKIGIFYGSQTGNTEAIARKLAKKLSVADKDVNDVAKTDALVSDYDFLLLGSSSTGVGDLQDDWEEFLPKIKAENMSGKKIALFACGDSSSFSDSFCGSMGKIYDALKDSGADFVGNNVQTEDYTFDDSEAVIDGKFVGLPIDEDNESDQTDERIEKWVERLKKQIVSNN